MFAPSFTRFGALALVLLAGCFAEPSTDLASDPTAEQSCTAGSIGCECYGNETCDAGLDCVTEISTCVPTGCAPGSQQCVCDAGACADGLECIAGLCGAPAAESSGSDPTDASTSVPDSESTSDVADDETTAGMPGADTSGGDAESSSSTVGPETGAPDCSALACGECVDCVAEPGGACEAQAEQCSAEEGCSAAAVCLVSCGAKGLCLDDCCADKSAAAALAAAALNNCRADQCAAACDNYNIGLCS